MKAKSLHETWDQLRARAPCLPHPRTPVGTGLVGKACQKSFWESSLAPREFATLALEMTNEQLKIQAPRRPQNTGYHQPQDKAETGKRSLSADC